MTEYLIPLEKLDGGFELCKQHVIHLYESAQILINSKKYVSAIPLLILALEECTKLEIISRCKYEKTGITKNEWNSIVKGGSHVYKMEKIDLDQREEIKSKGKSAFNLVLENQRKLGSMIDPVDYDTLLSTPINEEFHKGLNEIKKLCFYTEWRNSEFSSLLIKYSKEQKKALASFLIDYVGFLINNEIFGFKYPHVPRNENSPDWDEFKKDPIWLEALEWEKKTRTNEFLRKRTISMSLIHEILNDLKNNTKTSNESTNKIN